MGLLSFQLRSDASRLFVNVEHLFLRLCVEVKDSFAPR